MKKDIHPKYREVVFLDTSCGAQFLTRSTIETHETIEYQGKTYPLSKIEISSASHPVYTGIKHIVDSEGNVEKFHRRFNLRAGGKKTEENEKMGPDTAQQPKTHPVHTEKAAV